MLCSVEIWTIIDSLAHSICTVLAIAAVDVSGCWNIWAACVLLSLCLITVITRNASTIPLQSIAAVLFLNLPKIIWSYSHRVAKLNSEIPFFLSRVRDNFRNERVGKVSNQRIKLRDNAINRSDRSSVISAAMDPRWFCQVSKTRPRRPQSPPSVRRHPKRITTLSSVSLSRFLENFTIYPRLSCKLGRVSRSKFPDSSRPFRNTWRDKSIIYYPPLDQLNRLYRQRACGVLRTPRFRMISSDERTMSVLRVVRILKSSQSESQL